MKITLTNGQHVELPFAPSNCSGYRAERIEISAQDVRAMLKMAQTDPHYFELSMRQLEARFVTGRFSANDAHQAYVDFLTPSPEVEAVNRSISHAEKVALNKQFGKMKS